LTATDSASATGSVKLTLVNNPAAPDLAISAPARDIITASSILALTGAVSSSASPVTVSIVFDGQTFTPPVINGAFQQQLTLATEKTYEIVVTATDANAQSSVAQRYIIYSLTASGDVNGDGQVTVADALIAIKAAVNIITPTADELRRGNVAPLVQGVPAPDGSLNIQDALLILRKAVGLAW
jgi:hypothetical protein